MALVTAILGAFGLVVGAPATNASPAGAAVVASVGGATLSEAQLAALVERRLVPLRQSEFDIRKTAVEKFVLDRLMELEASKAGETLAAYKHRVTEEFKKAGATVDASEVQRIRERTRHLDSRSDNEALAAIRKELEDERVQNAIWSYLRGLHKRYGARINLKPPRVVVEVGDGPILGQPSAPVTVVAFLDYECPACARTAEHLRRLHERFPETVRVVVRDFPLTGHVSAMMASTAAECAGVQGRFWEMHYRLFESAPGFQTADLKRHAGEVGCDVERFAQCLESSSERRWRRSKSDGIAAGVTSTPTVYVNGRMLTDGGSFASLLAVVRDELDLVLSDAPSQRASEAAGR